MEELVDRKDKVVTQRHTQRHTHAMGRSSLALETTGNHDSRGKDKRPV